MPSGPVEEHLGIRMTNLDTSLFDGADATKRDLIIYLASVANHLLPVLADRPVTVMRVRPRQKPFVQKNRPRGTPDWVTTIPWWSESSQRNINYVVCDQLRTLLWFGNQRAVEYHSTLVTASNPTQFEYLVIDLDPPDAMSFPLVIEVARAAQHILEELGLRSALKTSGSKGLHIFVPIRSASTDDTAAALRALCLLIARMNPDIATTSFVKAERGNRVFVDPLRPASGTVAAAYSPRIRPGTPVSFPIGWDELDNVVPSDFTIRTVPALLTSHTSWLDSIPHATELPAALIEAGRSLR